MLEWCLLCFTIVGDLARFAVMHSMQHIRQKCNVCMCVRRRQVMYFEWHETPPINCLFRCALEPVLIKHTYRISCLSYIRSQILKSNTARTSAHSLYMHTYHTNLCDLEPVSLCCVVLAHSTRVHTVCNMCYQCRATLTNDVHVLPIICNMCCQCSGFMTSFMLATFSLRLIFRALRV